MNTNIKAKKARWVNGFDDAIMLLFMLPFWLNQTSATLLLVKLNIQQFLIFAKI